MPSALAAIVGFRTEICIRLALQNTNTITNNNNNINQTIKLKTSGGNETHRWSLRKMGTQASQAEIGVSGSKLSFYRGKILRLSAL